MNRYTSEIDESVPSKYVGGYRHLAKRDCEMCGGEGRLGNVVHNRIVSTATCLDCGGRGYVMVGCGGPAERDLHYGVSCCINGCGTGRRTFVPSDEVSG